MPRIMVTERKVPGSLPVVCPPRFVGRERELTVLAQALDAPPAVVLVEGEAGIGKSRLVQEFLASPAGQRQRVLVAYSPPLRTPCTWGAITDGLRQAVPDGISALPVSGLAGALRPLFPEWADALPPAPEPLEDATAARHRVFRALAELLDALDVSVLVVEDAHWADEATLEFLLFLTARQPQQMSLLVTYRPEDVPEGGLLRRLGARLSAGSTRARITLEPLDIPETVALVSSMLEAAVVSEEFAAFLHDHADGLPLAIEESVRVLADRHDLTRRDGAWLRRNLDQIAVPPTIRDAVLERTGRLDAAARAVLQAAAVFGDPVSETVLLSVSGLPVEQAARGLAAAVGCGLLTEDSMPNGQWLISFRHALAAGAVYEAMSARLRRQMHLCVARALEELSPQPVAPLAHHFRESGNTIQWCRYAEQAADLALACGDDATAAVLLHDLLAHGGMPAKAVVRVTQKIPLHALSGSGRRTDLVHSLRSALDCHTLTPAERAEAGYHLGRILMGAEEYAVAVAELEPAIPGLAHRPVDAANAMILLSWATRTPWPASVDRRWLDRATVTVAKSSLRAIDHLALTVARATALLLLGEETGWAVAAELPAEASTPQERPYLARGCLNIGEVAMRWGRYDEARRRLTAAVEMASEYGYSHQRHLVLMTLAHLDWFTGAWAGLADRVNALADLDVERFVGLDTVLVAGLLDAAVGARQSAEERLQLVLSEGSRRGGVNLTLESAAQLAWLHLREGRAEDALELTNDPMRIIIEKGVWLWGTDLVPSRVAALSAVGRCEEADRLVTAFAHGLRHCQAPAPHAALETSKAILAERQSDQARAADMFARAASAWETLPRPYDALLAREGQARCLVSAGECDVGLALLIRVCRSLSDLGAVGDVERVSRSLRGHGITAWHGWQGGRRGYGNQLSPRELEVVRLVVAGRTNKEIAQALCRGLKTVEMQLTSAMRKLGVSSRTALAVRVIEVGMLVAVLHDARWGGCVVAGGRGFRGGSGCGRVACDDTVSVSDTAGPPRYLLPKSGEGREVLGGTVAHGRQQRGGRGGSSA